MYREASAVDSSAARVSARLRFAVSSSADFAFLFAFAIFSLLRRQTRQALPPARLRLRHVEVGEFGARQWSRLATIDAPGVVARLLPLAPLRHLLEQLLRPHLRPHADDGDCLRHREVAEGVLGARSKFSDEQPAPASSQSAGCSPLASFRKISATLPSWYSRGRNEVRLKSTILLATTAAAAFLSPAQAAEKKGKTPEQACQAQALASIAREWPNILHGTFEIILKGDRCLVLLQAPAVFEDKHTARLLDGKTGELLSEFYGPKNSNRGLCTYRSGKFPTAECTWAEYLEKANQM